MKQRIKLTESQLHNIIRRCVNEAVDEENLEEGWFGDKWNPKGQKSELAFP